MFIEKGALENLLSESKNYETILHTYVSSLSKMIANEIKFKERLNEDSH